jgi:hypothetical protein
VALNGGDAVLALLLVLEAEVEAQRLVVKLSLTVVGWPQEKINGGVTSRLRAAARPARPLPQNDWENRVSRNSPSLAVALNCGIGSNSLNAEVKALERLQIVRGRNSSYLGSKYRSCTVRARCFGASSLPSTNASLDHHLGRNVCQFAFLPGFHLLSHWLKASLHTVDPNRNAIDERERLGVFSKDGRKHARDNVSRFRPANVRFPQADLQ